MSGKDSKQAAGADESPPNFFIEMLIILAKHKKLIIAFPILAAVIAAVIAIQMTKIYSSTSSVLPPQQQSSSASLLGQLGSLVSQSGTLGVRNPSEIYIGMLKSRTIADRLIERFNLVSAKELDSVSSARAALASATVIGLDKNGLINIAYEDSDANRAAEIANGYVEELLRLSASFSLTEASQRRAFLEQQLYESKNNLARTEKMAKTSLSEGGIAMVDEQSKSMLESTALLRAQLVSKEVQIQAMQGYASTQNPDLQKALREREALQAQVRKLEGTGARIGNTSERKAIDRGAESATLLREVKFQQFLHELLAKQYELAKIDEAKDGILIQIVDKAVAAERPIKPRRFQIVLLSFVAASFVALVLAFLLESISQMSNSEDGKWSIRRLRENLRWN